MLSLSAARLYPSPVRFFNVLHGKTLYWYWFRVGTFRLSRQMERILLYIARLCPYMWCAAILKNDVTMYADSYANQLPKHKKCLYDSVKARAKNKPLKLYSKQIKKMYTIQDNS